MTSPAVRGGTLLLGITGSIAAYKAADVASALTQDGTEVVTVMTRAATRFVAPLTFQSLTGQPVGLDIFEEGKGSKVEHIALARRADLVLIAPATADVIGKLAHGLADDLLTTAVLATTAPVAIAPAMNPAMWGNPVVQENLASLKARGVSVIEPAEGLLACGETGPGRMASVDRVIAEARRWLGRIESWKGRSVLVTAGPTREPLDAVRYVSNPSSGRMGFALAREARRRGASVLLVTGPTSLPDPFGVVVERVVTGEEMRRAVLGHAGRAQVVIKAAAVSDYRAVTPVAGKTKAERWTVNLEKAPNILEEVARACPGRILVGFAAEAGDPIVEGERKLRDRRLDLVVANDVAEAGSGFGADVNRVTLLHADGRREALPLQPKEQVAAHVLDAIEPLLARIPVVS